MTALDVSSPLPRAGTITAAMFASGTGLVKLGEAVASGSSTVLEVASIPAGYRSLLIEFRARNAAAGAGGTAARMTFEVTPTAGAYWYQSLLVNNATVTASQNPGTNAWIDLGLFPTDGATPAGLHGTSWMFIDQYAVAAAVKNVYGLNAGNNDASSGGMHQRNPSGFYTVAAAIDRVRVTAGAGGNWKAGSLLAVYGLPS